MSDVTAASTDNLVAEYHELRGPYGEAPAGETSEERQQREDRLAAVARELGNRDALPRVVSRAEGFDAHRRRGGYPYYGLI